MTSTVDESNASSIFRRRDCLSAMGGEMQGLVTKGDKITKDSEWLADENERYAHQW